jgi:hypothetical protein
MSQEMSPLLMKTDTSVDVDALSSHDLDENVHETIEPSDVMGMSTKVSIFLHDHISAYTLSLSTFRTPIRYSVAQNQSNSGVLLFVILRLSALSENIAQKYIGVFIE